MARFACFVTTGLRRAPAYGRRGRERIARPRVEARTAPPQYKSWRVLSFNAVPNLHQVPTQRHRLSVLSPCVVFLPSPEGPRVVVIFLPASVCSLQVTEQPAPLCIPLVLEPKSGFYWSPVCVLDFQSLYPSIIIANNICYSTALGSVEVCPLHCLAASPAPHLGSPQARPPP